MKISSIAGIVFLCVSGCGSPPKIPDVEFRGAMDVGIEHAGNTAGTYGMKGYFLVEGGEKKFTVYLNDNNSIPRGKAVVEQGKVIYEGVEFDSTMEKVLRYWPYLFGWGQNTKRIMVEYRDWQETSKGRLPAWVKVRLRNTSLSFRIYYEN